MDAMLSLKCVINTKQMATNQKSNCHIIIVKIKYRLVCLTQFKVRKSIRLNFENPP